MMNMKFIIASNNKKKLVELERILNPLGINAVTPKEEGITLDDVEENGTTFAENAFLKANAAYLKTGLPAVADDSGLCVDALDGRPGVYTARYGGEGLTDEERYIKLLDEMKNVDDDKRSAHFTSSICCILPDGSKITAEGICEGKIGYEPIGKDGFGYDPIFYLPQYGCTTAQLEPDVKNELSHRGKALRAIKEQLRKYCEEGAYEDTDRQ